MTVLPLGSWVGVGSQTTTDADHPCVVTRDPDHDGRIAAAIDALFVAGHGYRIDAELDVDRLETLVRLEVHGHLSRSNAIHLDVELPTGTSRPGGEVRSARAAVASDDEARLRIELSLEFTCASTGRRHVYAFGESGERLAVRALRITDLGQASAMPTDTVVVAELADGVHAGVAEWFRLENYLHVRLEYAKPGVPVREVLLGPQAPAVAGTVIGRRAPATGRRRRDRRTPGGAGWLVPQWRDAIEESPGLESLLGPAGSGCGYRIDVLLDDASDPRTLPASAFGPRQGLLVRFHHVDGSVVTIDVADLAGRSPALAHADLLWPALVQNPSARVLEIGGNGPTSADYKERVTTRFPQCSFTTMDVNDGPAVDVVGDAQFLDRYFAPGSFDVVYSVDVLEHVSSVDLVPRGVNHVLAEGGLALIVVPLVFPMHAEPTDYWRFTDHGLAEVFGPTFGFTVEDCGVRARCRVIPHLALPGMSDPSMQVQPAFLMSFVRSRKTIDLGPTGPRYAEQRPYDPMAYVFEG